MQRCLSLKISRTVPERVVRALFHRESEGNFETTRRVGANVAAVIKADDDEHLLEKDGTFVCVWEDGDDERQMQRDDRRSSDGAPIRVQRLLKRRNSSAVVVVVVVSSAPNDERNDETTPSSSEKSEGAATISIESLENSRRCCQARWK